MPRAHTGVDVFSMAIEQDMVSDKGRGVGMTAAASTQVRQMEEKIAAAKTDEDRQKARKEANVYRLVLVFEGDEGALVREELGPRPAVKLLEMCQMAQKSPPPGSE